MSSAMTKMKSVPIRISSRYVHQNQKRAVRNIYDALVELVTNSDDRYQLLRAHRLPVDGRIELEIERRRKETPTLVRVRDFADGMTLETMQIKLGQMGERVSGMEVGEAVRGTNSRGAKDIAVLGLVRFESIAEDGRYHRAEIDDSMHFTPYGPSQPASTDVRSRLGIPVGTGTLVTIEVNPTHKVAQHENLRKDLEYHISLRDILRERRVTLKDLTQSRVAALHEPKFDGTERKKVRLDIPGYPEADAKLFVYRSKKPLEQQRGPDRRVDGILIKSSRGIHEATYFDNSLEQDPCSRHFYGRLECKFIDRLWTDYDDRRESGKDLLQSNPTYILDPMRKGGLDKDHPFTKALFGAALAVFRPLVDEERRLEQAQKKEIESRKTRKRLNALEKVATEFLKENVEDFENEDVERDHGFSGPWSLSPRYSQLLVGHSQRFYFKLKQSLFPTISEGDSAQLRCLTDELTIPDPFAQFERDPSGEGLLRCVWSAQAYKVTKATGVQVHVSGVSIKPVPEAHVEVIDSLKQKYADVTTLQFERARYSLNLERGRTVRLVAPYPSVVSEPTSFDLSLSNKAFTVSGHQVLQPIPECGVAVCKLQIRAREPERQARIEAKFGSLSAEAFLKSDLPPGSPIEIKLEDEDFSPSRAIWQSNKLRVGIKFPSIHRYLGPNHEGQDEKHFQVLLAEIVAEAVCNKILERKIEEDRQQYEDYGWTQYYYDFSMLMRKFLKIAHEAIVND